MSNFAIIIVVGFPLTIIGGIFGKNWAGGFNAPCRTKNIPREIPPMPWWDYLNINKFRQVDVRH